MTISKKHYVTFYSPGTFVSEQSERDIDSWSPTLALYMAKSVTERHGAKPYAFRFQTKVVSEPIRDGYGGELRVEPRVTDTSGMYYIDGTIKTIDDIERENDDSNRVLMSNMRGNGWGRVVQTRNGYKHTAPFNDGDFVVSMRDAP